MEEHIQVEEASWQPVELCFMCFVFVLWNEARYCV